MKHWEDMSAEQAEVYREMLRRGLSERRVPRRERGGGARLLVAAAALATAALGTIALATGLVSVDPLLRIRDIRIAIDGPGAVTPEQVRAQLDLPPQATFTGLDWRAAVERVRALPRVGWVRLSYRWFHCLDVRVQERRATAMLVARDGETREVAGDGVVMVPEGETLADLPLLTWEGIDARTWPAAGQPLTVPGAGEVLHLLAALERTHPRLWAGISEARLRRDGSYELYWNHAPTVIWGRGEVSSLRLRAWARVMEDLRQRGDLDAVVDLRLRGQILVRLPEDDEDASGRATG